MSDGTAPGEREVSHRSGEASAPCSIPLAGQGPGGAGGAETMSVRVAIDRRAWSRVDLGGDGIEIVSKDSIRRTSAGSVKELIADGREALVSGVLQTLTIETGVRVETRSRLPEGAGLGETAAMASAVFAAAQAALGEGVGRPELIRRLQARRRADEKVGPRDRGEAVAVHGGTVAVYGSGERLQVEPLDVDPARVEEALLLADSGSSREAPEAERGTAVAPSGAAAAVRQALVEGRFEDVGGLLQEDWEARRRQSPEVTTAAIDRIVSLVHEHGGTAFACGDGPGGLVAVWAPPGARGRGPREAVVEALKEAGVRPLPVRVDLLGLDVG